MVKQLDLGPDDYKVRTRRGNWVARDATYMLPAALIMAGLWVGFAWWYRAEMPLVLLVSIVAAAAFFLGMIVGSWMKRFD